MKKIYQVVFRFEGEENRHVRIHQFTPEELLEHVKHETNDYKNGWIFDGATEM